MRKRCLDEVYELARRDERIVFIGSDSWRGDAGSVQERAPRSILHGRRERSEHRRNGRGPRPRGQDRLREHDCDVSDAALLPSRTFSIWACTTPTFA